VANGDESVQSAAQRMQARRVGTLVVIDSDQKPIGLVTDRDLAVRVVAAGRDPQATTVDQVMSPAPITIREETSIETSLTRMRSGACRRLPVVDQDGKLVGLVSLDDILELLSEEFQQIGELLEEEAPVRLPAW
jgi:CBS domain-containing protein